MRLLALCLSIVPLPVPLSCLIIALRPPASSPCLHIVYLSVLTVAMPQFAPIPCLHISCYALVCVFTTLALSYQTLGYALASVCVFTVLALSYQTPGYALAALDVTFAMFGHRPSPCILATLVLTYLSASSLCSILLCLAGANGTLICGFALFAC